MGIYSNLAVSEPAARAAAGQPVLLIVDDEQGPRESLRMVFKDRYQCVLASCGREGIELARNRRPDAAILDIRMPDISGVDVLREIKQLDPSVEVIMLTGYETIETARAAVHHGAADYLNKPFDVFVLRELLEKCMERRRHRRDLEDGLASLRQMNAQLTQQAADAGRVATASAMSAGVIHELNNPLSIVAGYAEMLERDVARLRAGDEVAVDEMQRRLGAIQREVERCKQIADRFLRFSRVHGDAHEQIALASLVEDITALLKAHPDRACVSIEYSGPRSPLSVQAHPGQLMQVLLNLGINALQAMQGHGTLRIITDSANAPAAPAYKSPDFDPQKPLVRISISDTGPGIPPETLDKLFTPYFSTKQHGNGLGLAITAEIIGRHGGAIEIQSIVGNGTTFSVYLPAVG